jgi:hypothetical protein
VLIGLVAMIHRTSVSRCVEGAETRNLLAFLAPASSPMS